MKSYLTVLDPELEKAQRSTPHGMAHWAGSGPEGATCGQCLLYGYSYVKKSGGLENRLSCCEKYYQMTKRHGDNLRADQSGCKYFKKREPRR